MALLLPRLLPHAELFQASRSIWGQRDGGLPRRKGYGRFGRLARSLGGVCADGRTLREVASGLRYRRWHSSRGCIEANAHALARYAGLCQEAGLVPVVEPEVLMEGDHTLDVCSEVTERVLRTVFRELYSQRVKLEGMILKPNMVLPGLDLPTAGVGGGSSRCNCRLSAASVPAAVPGVVFLSGGQSGELASARLNAMNVRYKSRLPWELSFSFGRAIQEPALEIWHGEQANVIPAQEALYHRAKCDGAAHRGEYTRDIFGFGRRGATSAIEDSTNHIVGRSPHKWRRARRE
jgi:hypothetical protein